MREQAIRLVDAAFTGPLADDAEYVAPGGSPTGEANCRIMKRAADAEAGLLQGFDTRPHTQDYFVEVRVSEVETLTDGASFVTPAATYLVAEKPVKPDSERLKWRARCRVKDAPGG